MVHIECDHKEIGFHYSCLGSHHGAQVANPDDEARVMEFGAKMAALVREHFGAVTPILDEPLKRR